MKRALMTVFLLSFLLPIYAQKDTLDVTGSKNFRLRYVINVAELDTAFVDNGERAADIRDFLTQIKNDSLTHITGVDFRGTASPDGTYEFNVWLSENRLRTFKELVNSYITIPDSLIYAQSSAIPWDEFRQKVEESDIDHKAEVLTVIDMEPKNVPFWGGRTIDHRLLKLKKMYGGKVWEELKKPILFDLRYGNATFYYTTLLPMPFLDIPLDMEMQMDIIPINPSINFTTWTPRIYLKTNLIGLAAGSVNLAAEFDLAPHWSFNFPIYYCAWDYFKSTIKFRNFTIQPEFRYWPRVMSRGYNDGFFIGAHFGAMAFNFAIGGKYRYQDRRGTHPALGGGLAIGYRKPISKNQRWHVEFSAGAGYYHLDYDVFENTPNYKEGEWVRKKKKNWFGLDQLTISLSYNFPLTHRQRRYLDGKYLKGGDL